MLFYPCAECGIREMESVEKKEEGVEGEGGLGQKFEILLLFFEAVLRSI